MSYRFDGNEGTFISTADAKEMVSKYQNNHPSKVKAYFYGKNKLENLIEQAGCMGIRIYYAEDASGKPQMVLIGADADGNDLDALILDLGEPCPEKCPERSALK